MQIIISEPKKAIIAHPQFSSEKSHVSTIYVDAWSNALMKLADTDIS